MQPVCHNGEPHAQGRATCGCSRACLWQNWKAAQQAARDAEAAGFDAVMSVELGHDVFAPLAVAALATDRVELTPSVAVAFPRSPTVLASQAWDLQANSHGRFVLGTGQPGEGPQRTPLRHRVERAGAAAARLRAGVARDMALLGDAGKSSTSTASTTR